MILKWKTILTNWINCYTSENEKRQQNITPENLLNIFTHIHESFRLDDSKYSKFEASTIQDFIVEKYPGFKFENGTLEATCEEEVYIVASLLLFFICVNSKNAEIKRAMCSKLSAGDQETIMKFSKCLMECSPILYADVEAAITEACGPDASDKVAETPPALRSLHGEVRRLQAALDAERFDRNYLQDELARTNLKLEKLTKVKEQYKLDIVNLKAKISLCCGEKRESHREARADTFIAQLQRQLQDLETRLEDTLNQLEDVQQERDTYKEKVTDLKQERDKWLSLSQQEADKAGQLAEQLDAERRTVATLRDLVSELRQHNRNNGLDSSMLECDDPDTSIQSLSNLSVCTEVCANVIEVQLGEERAKIEVLKQQIQSLQEQLAKANRNFESEKLALETVITEKDNIIVNFKQRVDEEIEEKSKLESNYKQEIDQLNKKLQEMTQLIKDLEESAEHSLEEKLQEIQSLQKHFANETDKLVNVIDALKKELETQNNLRKEYDEEIVKLKNKIVEITLALNNIEESSKRELAEKQQEISILQHKLTEETEKSSNIIMNLQTEIDEQKSLKTQFEQDIVVLNNIIVEISQNLKDTEDKSKRLLEEKEQETQKYSHLIKQLDEKLKEQTSLKTHCDQEIVELNYKIVEMTQTIKEVEENSKQLLEKKEEAIGTLQLQLAGETQKSSNYNKELQEQLTEQNNFKTRCEQDIVELNNKLVAVSQEMKNVKEGSQLVIEQKEQEIKTLHQRYSIEMEKTSTMITDLQEKIKEQLELKTNQELELHELNNKIDEMAQTMKETEENSKHLLKDKEKVIQTLRQQLSVDFEKSDHMIKSLQEKFNEQISLKTQCEHEIVELNTKIITMSQTINNLEESSEEKLKEKEQKLRNLQQQLVEETEKSNDVIKNLQGEINELNGIKTHCEQEIVELNHKIVETTHTLKDLEDNSKYILEVKEQEIKSMQKQFEEDIKKIEIKNKILEIEILEAINLKKCCDQEINKLNIKINELSQAVRDTEESSKLALEEKEQAKYILQQKFTEETDKSAKIIQNLNKELENEKYTHGNLKEEFQKQLQEKDQNNSQKDMFIGELNQEVKRLTVCVSTLEKRCQKIIDDNRKEIQSLNQEIVKLSNNAVEKSQAINDLEETSRLALEQKVQEIQSQQQQFVADRDKSENIIKNLKIELEAEKYAQLKLKEDFDNRIMKLNEKVLNRNNELVELQNNIIQKSEMIEVIQSDLRREKELRDELSNTCNHQLSSLNEERNAIETDLQKKLHDITDLQKQLQEREVFIDKSNKEIENLRTCISNLEEKCRHRDGVIKEKQKEIEFINDVYQKEQEKLNHKIDERNASIKSLQMQLQNEIEYKIQLQDELSELKSSKLSLIEELNAAKILMKNYEEKTLEWDKQRNEMKDEIETNNKKVKKLEEERTILSKDIEVLKDIQSGEAKDHQEKIAILEKQKIDMDKHIQDNLIQVKKLNDEKMLLLKEVDDLKAFQIEEINNHEQKIIMWEKQKMELDRQVQANVLEVEKLEEGKAALLKVIEELKEVQIGETKMYEEKMLVFEKQTNEMKEQMQANNYTISKLEEEKIAFLNELEVLKTAQMRAIKDHKENIVTWEKEKIELNEEMEALNVKVKELENEKAMLSKEMEVFHAMRTEETKIREENTLMIAKLEDEKEALQKTVEVLTTAQSEDAKDHEEKKLIWEKQKIELDEQMHVLVVKVENLEDEKAMLLKEMEALKSLQTNETKKHKDNTLTLEKQTSELMEQIQESNLKITKLERENAVLLKEMEVIKTTQSEEAKVYEENTIILEKQINETQEQLQVNVLKVEKLEEEKMNLLKEVEELKSVESGEAKDREEKAILWVKEKIELNDKLRDQGLKVKKLEEEKTIMTRKIEELIGAQTYACFKKEHEEKIRMLEKQETDLKEQMKVDALKVEMLEQEKTMLLKELEALKAAQKEMLAAASQDKITATKHSSWEKEIQGMHQVDTTTSDLGHSSMESLKTISDLEKIIQDKNRKITSMQIEISYIKSMMAESGIKLIDVTKELEVSKDTCQELSSQLKKIVQQKNEEISELKRQVAKMSATENRASQIIKLSAKYQAMILKRIAEIKSSAVLKELTNFGNQNSNGDELRRSIGSVTMEDLENFLETTDRHLKRCSEKQMALQKDRDRLSEVNRINESEIINMKKFLTEMSVSFRTFTTVKEVYNQKLSKVVSLQRAVRRDILSLDGRITEATMCKLERGYAAVMQDLSECAMNLERWVDRSVSRMLSAEKIKQAFTSDLEQASLSTCNYQNASVEVQLSELENSFQKLLAEIGRAHKGEGARSAQEVTIMEVRAEYEDKLNRMKAKMKELFHEEMGRLKQKQADEIAILEKELVKCKEKMAESSTAYEEHIRALTTELWSVGEKFLVKQEEADWLRKKQSGSLMSLQHVHSSGLHTHGHGQETFGRPSDTHSLRSLPVHNKKTEARGLHMSDEEGEVFDNRFLKELAATPRASLAPGQRISELKRRNSLVPPHLKSSYPAEMQFAPTLDEEDIKCASFSMGRAQRKEVGITAYKKPGPPTPSKQAGRLSATDSELRESLRVDADPGRKTSTPSRIRSLFRSNRNETDVVTPRSRRFSSIFRKK